MHQIHDIARCPVEAPAYIGEVGTDPVFLQRRLDPRAVGWYGLVEDNGWCGWVMLEWFDRLRRNASCERLALTSPRDRACLASFITARLLVVTHVSTKTVLQKCLVRLREHRFRPLAPGDEISLTIKMVKHLSLGFEVAVWEVVGAVASLSSQVTDNGLLSAVELLAALSTPYHMAISCLHFHPFPLPGGVPKLGSLTDQLCSAIRAEYNLVELAVPEVEPPSGPPGTELFSLFVGKPNPPQVRHLGGPGFDPCKAVVMHYNVDALTDVKIDLIGLQAAAMNLDLFHLVDVRVSAKRWPGVQAGKEEITKPARWVSRSLATRTGCLRSRVMRYLN